MSNPKLTHPERISKVLDHRSQKLKVLMLGSLHNKTKNGGSAVIAGLAVQDKNIKLPTSSSDLNGIRPITLRDMDRTADLVYRGRAIKLTIIEDPIVGYYPSIPTVVEDENGDAERLAIYGLDKEDPFLMAKIGNGCKITVVNPYHRMAVDGKPAIRVDFDDDKNSLHFHYNEAIKNRCRFCGAANAERRCGKCHQAWYCDRECQLKDWKIMKHKIICLPW